MDSENHDVDEKRKAEDMGLDGIDVATWARRRDTG